ncbi:MAG TPA: hypothetical protein VMW73_11675 [Spirochaetia bacterium]|nr:hypothetical protein [Spirochaetia bacterium]
MSTRLDASYWTSVKAGDYISLTDYQSFEEGGAGGLDYNVKDVRRIGILDQDTERVIAEYHVHDLEREGKGRIYFVVVKVEAEFELRVYYVPQGFLTGTRDELIDHGHTWFFLPPADPEDFISSDLEYAPYPDVPPIDENGKISRREYSFAGFGHAVYGTYRRGKEEVPVILTEYLTAEEAMNPLLLIIEEQWIRPDGSVPEEGGLITPLLGCVVQPESAEVYPA